MTTDSPRDNRPAFASNPDEHSSTTSRSGMVDPTAIYLQDLRDIRSSGAAVKETSYYGALANLLNGIRNGYAARIEN
jgi:hypothetical protein